MSKSKHLGTLTFSAASLFAALMTVAPASAQVVLNVNNWAGPTYPVASRPEYALARRANVSAPSNSPKSRKAMSP